MVAIFFSYSHKDEALRNELQTHLALLQRKGVVDTWHDRRITAGQEFDSEISKRLDEADLILLLISSDFISSEYCWGVEVRRAMERHQAGEAVVIPVILRPCLWQDAPFGKLLAAPTDGKPVTKWPDRDEAFLDVTRIIQTAVHGLKHEGDRQSTPASQRKLTASVPRVDRPRSSKLAIAKVFTQADKDQFLHDAFDYITKYFEGSLDALAERNPEITARFRLIDANRFTATAYRNGKKTAACTIWTGGDAFSRGINYFGDDAGRTDTLNESLGVDADGNGLFLKIVFGSLSGGQERKLTMEGGAEYLWSKFLEPLQRYNR